MEKICNNVKITNVDFVDGEPTICSLEFKLNLKEIERQYFQFTTQFIKNKLSKHMPVVYTVWSFDYNEGVSKCRAKYLLEKYKGEATVLYIDKGYYSDKENIPEVRETIKLKSVFKARKRLGEYSDYAYVETMKVIGIAKVHPDDKYDLLTGKTVSKTKAIRAMCNKIIGVYSEMALTTSSMLDDLHDAATDYLKCYIDCNNVLEKA